MVIECENNRNVVSITEKYTNQKRLKWKKTVILAHINPLEQPLCNGIYKLLKKQTNIL